MGRAGRVRRWLGVACVGLAGAPASALAGDVEAIRACMRANAPSKSSVQTVLTRVEDALGEASESRARIYWRRLPSGQKRLLVRMKSPEELAGAGVLVIGLGERVPGVYVYLPAVGEARRVIGTEDVGRIVGGAIPVEELRRIVELSDRAELRLVEETQLAGRRVWVVEARPTDAAPDERIVALVDQEYCLPLRLQVFEAGERLRARIEVDPGLVTRAAETWSPRRLVVEDLAARTRTTLTVESLEVDIPLAPSLFTVPALAEMTH